MAGEPESLQSLKMVQVRRPSPALVLEIVKRLRETADPVPVAMLAAATQNETGCSRATAYRAIRDFKEELQSGAFEGWLYGKAALVRRPRQASQ